jgi:hypothetical protein
MSTRVFFNVSGRASRSMNCEFCNHALDYVDGYENRRIHTIAPTVKPWMWNEEHYQRMKVCPNQGKTFEFPCAIEVK